MSGSQQYFSTSQYSSNLNRPEIVLRDSAACFLEASGIYTALICKHMTRVRQHVLVKRKVAHKVSNVTSPLPAYHLPWDVWSAATNEMQRADMNE